MTAQPNPEFLQQLSDATRDLVEPTEIMATVARMLGEHLGTSRCAYADVSADEDSFTILQDYSVGCRSIVGEYSLERFGPRAAQELRGGETLVVHHVPEELAPNGGAEMFAAIDIQAIICCPLIKQGELRAMMAVHQTVPRNWTDEEIALVTEVVDRSWAIIERARAERAARRYQQRFYDLFELSADAIVLVTEQGTISQINRQVEELFLYSRDELIGQPVETLLPEDRRTRHEQLRRAYFTQPRPRAMGDGQSELHGRRRDGSQFRVEISLTPIQTEEGQLVAAGIRDISERIDLEARLKISQRMETVGRLAGGIAHDFNNLLTVIINTIDLVLEEYESEDEAILAELTTVRDAGTQAAELTHQLLAFSRQQVLQPEVIELNAIVERLIPIVRRLIGEHIVVQFQPGADCDSVFVDPTQMEQVLMNLAANARDAMPGGGTLMFRTSNLHLDDTSCLKAIPRGEYVLLEVADSGMGMPEDVQKRIFDPFFSTKQIGSGTGLGLATVYGIVKQSGGEVVVLSEVGQGTTFRVYLPATVGDGPRVGHVSTRQGGTQTTRFDRQQHVLLVEDDDAVRQIATRMLVNLGFNVATAASGSEALALLDGGRNRFDLMLTDVIMPGINGVELAKQARAIEPRIKILYVSGYTADLIGQHGVLDGEQHLISKPYRLATLTRAIQDVLQS